MLRFRGPTLISRYRARIGVGSKILGRYLLLIGILCLFIWQYYRRDALPSHSTKIADTQPYPISQHEQAASMGRSKMNGHRAEAVREAFVHGWKGYKEFAFAHNELMPISRGPSDSRAAWPATAVDSLTTAILMDVRDVIEDVLDLIDTTEFNTTDHQVSMFSSTKTFIGGMLSAHDLLSGPKIHLVRDRSKIKRLVEQAQSIAESIAFAFDTESGLPQNYLFLNPQPQHRNVSVTDITAAGTLSLEWTRLSDMTKNGRYARLVAGAEAAILHAFDPRNNDNCQQLFNGLFGKVMDLQSGKFETFTGGFMSGSGSFYEYLLKLYIYSPTDYEAYRDHWIDAADAAIEHLSSHPSSRPDLTFLATYNCMDLQYVTDHTAFFAAGNFILGGSVLHEPKYVEFGLQLVESQVATYRATKTGLAPDRWTWLPDYCKGRASTGASECRLPPECLRQSAAYVEQGNCVLDHTSRIRPETLESLYYAYRITRDPKYQDMSWEIFTAINKTARVPSGGFSGIADVNVLPGTDGISGRIDSMYTWIMGETLKYAWMIHVDEDAEWHTSADGTNEWVFNTQAHPLKVR